jgi:eukaryotic-like serine/threonine-protein kinase
MAIRFEANVEPVPGYQLLERIGSGGFGEVWKCLAPGGIYKAIKIIHGDLRSKDNDLVRYAEQELKSLERVKQVRHPYLLALDRYDIVEGRLLIVMELADCNLWEKFREHRLTGSPGIPRPELMQYMQETAEVLDLMNREHGLLHLDVKPQNIFLQWNHVKVGDFGQVKDLQGLAAQVTGGITPVYAAPETFDGIVTRACDQYSLACVYQELLTGIRPFDGTSMNQLLMQHLAAAPNLLPSPENDRPVLARALAKKHEERFACCLDFVAALRNGPSSLGSKSKTLSTAGQSLVSALMGTGEESTGSSYDSESNDSGVAASPIVSAPAAPVYLVEEPQRPPTPEKTGTGSLRPSLMVGLGTAGLQFLQRLEWQLDTTYKFRQQCDLIQYLYLETDPLALAQATTGRSWDRVAPLRETDLFHARLQRPTHYLKSKSSNRLLADDWFDQQLLNKLSRTPTTMGYRQIGRLAFADHFRLISQQITAKLETCTNPEVLAQGQQLTGLEMRTNRPRVYLVASLAGGTGGGMFLDVAYTIRQRLKLLGYTQPEIHGYLLLPPDNTYEQLSPLQRANVYAALTELHHYTRPDTTYRSHFDDRLAPIQDNAPPFNVIHLLPDQPENINTPSNVNTPSAIKVSRKSSYDGPTTRPKPATEEGSTNPHAVSLCATRVYWDLMTPIGRTVDEQRLSLSDQQGIVIKTFGATELTWPRGAIIDRTARILSGVLVTHWVSPDISRARHKIPQWVSERMRDLGLSRELVLQSMQQSSAAIKGEPLLAHVAKLFAPQLPKGWLARLPDVNKLIPILNEVGRILGTPTSTKSSSLLEDTLRTNANDLALNASVELKNAIYHMIDDPEYRLASAVEALQQILNYLQACKAECEAEAERAERIARAQYEPLMAFIHPQSGIKRPTTQELSDALRQFPSAQLQAQISRRAERLYEHLKSDLSEMRKEVAELRRRLEDVQRKCVANLEQVNPPIDHLQLMPAGCQSIEDAAQRYLSVLTDDDLQEVERQVQIGLEESHGGLYQAAMNSTLDAGTILDTAHSKVRGYLNTRLGEVDLTAMFAARYGDTTTTGRVLADAYQRAAPSLLRGGPWTKRAITVVGLPVGPSSEPLHEAVDKVIPVEDTLSSVETPDAICFYREYPNVPLNVLPQLGPAWESAYQNSTESNVSYSHSRQDVTQWFTVDSHP